MTERTDVVVIGGGIMGCSLAYHLAKRGMDVTVVEKTHCGAEASGRNEGGVRAQGRDPAELPLAMASKERWLGLSDELNYDVEYRRGGNLELAATEEEFRVIRNRVKAEQEAGLDVQLVDSNEACEILPHLNRNLIFGGSYCRSDGTANPIKATLAYSWTAKRLGARIHTVTKATGLKAKNGRITCVETTRGDIEASTVVNATGPWAPDIGRMAGVDLPIEPKRTQVFVTQQVPADTCKPFTSFSEPYDGDWTQTLHGNVLLGHWSRSMDGFQRDVTFEAISYQCYRTVQAFGGTPLLGKVPLIRAFTGWTDWTPDAIPIIDYAKNLDGFFILAGFSGHGFCLGPICGEIVADVIMDGKSRLPIDGFRFDRFKKPLMEE